MAKLLTPNPHTLPPFFPPPPGPAVQATIEKESQHVRRSH